MYNLLKTKEGLSVAFTNTALITGATSGIGYELCKLFAKNGYNLVLIARNEQKLKDIESETFSHR